MEIKKLVGFKTSQTRFTIVFTTLMFVVCNSLNIDKIARWFYLKDGLDVTALCAYLVAGLSLSIVIFVIFSSRWTIKPLAITLIVLSAASTYFISKYGVAVDESMVINVVYTDSSEVESLLSIQMIPYLMFLIVLPTFLVINTEITSEKTLSELLSSIKLGVLALLVAISALYLKSDSIIRAGNISQKNIVHMLVPINYLSGIFGGVSGEIASLYKKAKPKTDFKATVSGNQDVVVVLAVGESSRQKNFNLYGYTRVMTNPVLSKVKNLHVLNGIARLGSTHFAIPEILDKKGVKLTQITTRVGIDTSCYVNYTLVGNCAPLKEISGSNCRHDECYDEDVVPLLHQNLKSYRHGRRFIVLHLGGGSHGPLYKKRHPPEFLRFGPMCNDADVVNKCTVEELYNSYDNTILYVDYVLGKIITELDGSRVPYVFIYLSDHGESLLENGKIFHGTPPGIPLPPEQAHIPLLVKSSIPISIAKRDEYKQPDVYDSILELLSIKVDIIDGKGSFIKLH